MENDDPAADFSGETNQCAVSSAIPPHGQQKLAPGTFVMRVPKDRVLQLPHQQPRQQQHKLAPAGTYIIVRMPKDRVLHIPPPDKVRLCHRRRHRRLFLFIVILCLAVHVGGVMYLVLTSTHRESAN